MSEPQLTASLERLRNARSVSAEAESEFASAQPMAPEPLQPLPTRQLRRAPQSPHSQHPPVQSEAALGAWGAAAQGHLASLDDVGRGKPRLALAPRAALAAVFAVLALTGGIFSAHLLTAQAQPITIESATANSEPISIPQDAANATAGLGEDLAITDAVIVHVAGAVNQPGIVELPTGARVAQAVEQAGGATEEAELNAVNLARPVVDGEQIIVPKVGEVVASATETASALDLSQLPDGTGRINLNQANSELLEQLPGIGPALAGRIIEFREQTGGFGSIEQLQEVSGIGPAVMNDVRDKITV